MAVNIYPKWSTESRPGQWVAVSPKWSSNTASYRYSCELKHESARKA